MGGCCKNEKVKGEGWTGDDTHGCKRRKKKEGEIMERLTRTLINNMTSPTEGTGGNVMPTKHAQTALRKRIKGREVTTPFVFKIRLLDKRTRVEVNCELRLE